MNISYYIQKTGKVNTKGTTSVMLDFAWRGYRLQLSSGVLVEPANFVNTKKTLIHTRQDDSLALNWKLQKLKTDLLAGYHDLEMKNGLVLDITRVMVKEMFLRVTGKKDRRAAAPLLAKSAGTDIWVTHTRWQDLNRHKHSPGHLRRFLPVKKWLDQYAPSLTLEQLSEEWVQEYTNWLLENSSLRNGGMRAHFIFFRLMLKQARMPYEWLVQPFSEYTPGVDLTYSEVMQLSRADYPSLTLRETADMYIFLTQVGLRFSDYLALDKVVPVQTPTGEVLVILDHRQQKTKQPVTIPLTDLARQIWEKYAGKLPKPTNQTFNWRIKQAAAVAGLTRMIDQTTVRGKEYNTVQRPLYEIISAHTARHTCASLLLEGSGGKAISQLTLGQQDRKSTDIYSRPKMQQEIDEFNAAWTNVSSKNAQ